MTMPQRHVALRLLAALTLVLSGSSAAFAWSLTMSSASRRVYLHVGNGVEAGDSGTINVVSVTVPSNQLGNGTPLAMTSNSTQSRSLQGDNYLTCPTPASQLLIGASYQRNNAGGGSAPMSATLSVSSPATLINTSGDSIPISEVSWTVSAPGSSVPNIIPAGTYNGGTQFLATIPANTYIENCHSFSYANSAVRAAGTYTATITYTVTSP
ncbi:MAG: hypothetical protein KF871_00830 [Hydrogenophaga sp.]|uniref:hypothetical protein n=1 Tax=Hydrogenophaga sp. TaxID=1904254 RepID=UPI001D453220|nr:hypothetical protein [Hydrogenophaga sp.]MBX3608411.1 hypothetical protein [Hydrogenophaga sp.]